MLSEGHVFVLVWTGLEFLRETPTGEYEVIEPVGFNEEFLRVMNFALHFPRRLLVDVRKAYVWGAPGEWEKSVARYDTISGSYGVTRCDGSGHWEMLHNSEVDGTPCLQSQVNEQRWNRWCTVFGMMKVWSI